jgi:putative chitinase
VNTDAWGEILFACGVRPITVARWASIFADEIPSVNRFSAGRAELDDFLGQILHESGKLECVEENLNYSTPERLMDVWPQRFPTLDSARPYVRNPRALANLVYGGRMGNSGPDDGWIFRGSGLVQVTGRANVEVLAKATGWETPEVLAESLRRDGNTALRASIAWWEGNVPDGIMGDIARVTRRLNGGTHGLDDRRRLTELADNAIDRKGIA